MLDLISVFSAALEAVDAVVQSAPNVEPDDPKPLPCPQSQAPTWGDLLSVLTVSVALNMAYFTVSSFVSPIAANQKNLLGLLSQSIAKIQDKENRQPKETDLVALQDRLVRIEYDERSAGKPFRFAAILAFFAGMVLVVVGTFMFEQKAPGWLPLAATLLSFPFLFMVLYVAVVLSNRYAVLASDREKLEAGIKTLLSAQTQKAKAEAEPKAKAEAEAEAATAAAGIVEAVVTANATK